MDRSTKLAIVAISAISGAAAIGMGALSIFGGILRLFVAMTGEGPSPQKDWDYGCLLLTSGVTSLVFGSIALLLVCVVMDRSRE